MYVETISEISNNTWIYKEGRLRTRKPGVGRKLLTKLTLVQIEFYTIYHLHVLLFLKKQSMRIRLEQFSEGNLAT